VTGDVIDSNIPVVSMILAADTGDESLANIQEGDLVFVNCPEKTAHDRYIVCPLTVVNSWLRSGAAEKDSSTFAAEFARNAGDGSAANDYSAAAPGGGKKRGAGGGGGSADDTNDFSTYWTEREALDVSDSASDRYAFTPTEAASKWLPLGPIHLDESFNGSADRALTLVKLGRAKIPWIVQGDVQHGDWIGLQYYEADLSTGNNGLYDRGGRRIEGPGVSRAIQIRVVLLKQRRKVSPFDETYGAKASQLVPQTRIAVSVANTNSRGVPIVSEQVIRSALDRGRVAGTIRTNKLRPAFTIPIGRVAELHGFAAPADLIDDAHVSDIAYKQCMESGHLIIQVCKPVRSSSDYDYTRATIDDELSEMLAASRPFALGNRY
jgi:hypothetical protein